MASRFSEIITNDDSIVDEENHFVIYNRQGIDYIAKQQVYTLLFDDSGNVLVAKKKDAHPHGGGKYCYPGGGLKIEEILSGHEGIKIGAIREFKEETGVDLLGYLSDKNKYRIESYPTGKETKHYHFLFCNIPDKYLSGIRGIAERNLENRENSAKDKANDELEIVRILPYKIALNYFESDTYKYYNKGTSAYGSAVPHCEWFIEPTKFILDMLNLHR